MKIILFLFCVRFFENANAFLNFKIYKLVGFLIKQLIINRVLELEF